MNVSDNAQHEADGRLDMTSKSSGRGSTHESATDIEGSSKRDSSEIGFATTAGNMSSKTPRKERSGIECSRFREHFLSNVIRKKPLLAVNKSTQKKCALFQY